MKLFRAVLIGAATIALMPMTSWAFTPGAGLAGTPHDWSATNGVGACTFCHTPHKAITTGLLWNHTLSTNSFSWDVPETTGGTPFATFKGDTYKGPTAKCLSCHDGSVAIGDVAWWEEGKPAAPINGTKHPDGDPFNVGFGGSMKGNHPVAMPFPLNGAASHYNGVTNGAEAVLSGWVANPTTNNIRLFSDDGTGNIKAGVTAGQTGLECSSCHDPHNKAAVDDWFLRGMHVGNVSGGAGGYICLSCHNK
jgi:hypothetical protein